LNVFKRFLNFFLERFYMYDENRFVDISVKNDPIMVKVGMPNQIITTINKRLGYGQGTVPCVSGTLHWRLI